MKEGREKESGMVPAHSKSQATCSFRVIIAILLTETGGKDGDSPKE